MMLGVAREVVAPDFFQDAIARDHLFGAAHQVFQQVTLLGGEFDQATVAEHLAGTAIQRQVSKLQCVGVGFLGAAQVGAEAGQQFLNAKGLDEADSWAIATS